jgi:hypothetical protein
VAQSTKYANSVSPKRALPQGYPECRDQYQVQRLIRALKSIVFSDIMSCSLVEVYRRFG